MLLLLLARFVTDRNCAWTSTSRVLRCVFKINDTRYVDATLIEPALCACHGLDKIKPRLGSSVLMFSAGPTGLVNLWCQERRGW